MNEPSRTVERVAPVDVGPSAASPHDDDRTYAELGWCSARAGRLSVLIDACDYFAALDEALRGARRGVRIMGWDLDLRVRLRPGDDPRPFGQLLVDCLDRRPELRVRCLVWSLIGVRAGGRELPPFGTSWSGHPRLDIRYDLERPIESAPHEKLVTIDGAVAFVGCTDVSRERWDVRGHDRSVEGLRVTADGEPYGPHHDLQAVMDGPVVRRFDEHFESAWARVCGEPSPRPSPGTSRRASGEDVPATAIGTAWPSGVPVDFERPLVHLSRTAPPLGPTPGIAEVRRTVEAIIARARRLLYIEMQYLTSDAIGRALCARLAGADPPHVLLVLPEHANTLIERRVMQPLQNEQLCRLREHDRRDRLRVVFPALPEGHGELMLHSKLTIADDDVLHLGSANFNERSMSVDTELDFTLCAKDARARAAVADVRHRLVAEHLGLPTCEVAADGGDPRRLFARVARHAHRRPGLHRYPIESDPAASRPAIHRGLADPATLYGAFEMDTLELDAGQVRKRLWTGLAGIALACIGLALLWTLTPAEEWFRGWLIERGSERSALAIAGVIAALSVASLAMMPITLITVVCFVLLGPWLGMGAALVVSLGSAAVAWWLGQRLNDSWLERLSGSRFEALKAKLDAAAHGVPLVVAIRFMPVAPFTAVNLALGAAGIRFGHFMLGSFLGLLPGKLVIAVFADRALRLIEDPSWQSVLVAALVAVVTVGATYLGARWLERRTSA